MLGAISWEFMRDLGLIIFGAGTTLVVCKYSRIFLQDLGAANVTLMATVGDVMMLAGACLAVAAMAVGYWMPGGNP
jgi:hypothetical protein